MPAVRRPWRRSAELSSARTAAAVVHDFSSPLVIEEVPIPEPGAEQLLVRVEASGLCHTDIHAARRAWPVKPAPPLIPGHEGVGVVERIGPGNPHGLVEAMQQVLDGSAPSPRLVFDVAGRMAGTAPAEAHATA